MSPDEIRVAREMLELARRLAGSDTLSTRRAGERATAIMADLIYEHDPWSGVPDLEPKRADPAHSKTIPSKTAT